MNYKYNPFLSFRSYPMQTQTQIDSFLMPPSAPKTINRQNRRGISKTMKDIITTSNRKHNGGRLKCQYCKQGIRFTGRQKKNCSIMFDYVYPKEVFKTEDEYYSYFNCVASCRRCHLLKKEKPYHVLVTELFKKSRLQISPTYEIPMILD